MRRTLIAVLLSALVFPGLGHFYNHDRKKGIILVLVANLLLGLVVLGGLVIFSQEYLSIYYPAPLSREILPSMLLHTITHPVFLLLFGGFMALWGFAAVDAGRQAARPPREEA